MELRQLEYFVAVVRHGGVRHAADELDVSPGNISEQIKSLERELGVRLFDRGPRSLRLTEAGDAFLGRVEQVVSLLKTAREEMLDLPSSSAANYWLGPCQASDHSGSLAFSWTS